jgi:Phage tail protein.
MNSNDTLMIDGINSYLNGDLADNQTNYGYISLATGWNSFKIISATDLDITFSFPFIYLG